MLKAEGISFGYGKDPVFTDVSLSVTPGSITALLGPSGSGKTTLLKCLAMLQAPQRGRIVIDEQIHDFPLDPNAAPPMPWPQLTVVFQQLFLWPHLTLRQNILLPVKRRDPAAVQQKLAELTELFGMAEFLNRYPNETSRGQQQRVALARALMLNPRYILCDEITSALDVEQVGKVLECLNLVREQGVGVLLITHQIGFARRSCDGFVFIDGGQVVEHGGQEQLIQPRTDRFAQFLKMVEAAH
jgi:ABC-type polar amino acid transport system ATPase subunit